MKRVFAHIGFSAALTLFILNFFSVSFARLTLGVLAALFLFSLAVPKIRQAVAVPLCIGSAALSCIVFIAAVQADYAPQQSLDGVSCDTVFYITEEKQAGSSYQYTVRTSQISAPQAPQNIKLSVSSDSRIVCDCGEWIQAELTYSAIAQNGYDSAGAFGDGIFMKAELRQYQRTGEKAGGMMPLILRLRNAISDVLLSALNGDHGALACALLTGDKQHISDAAADRFYACGATHLMAVSGLHLSVIAGTLYFVLKRLYTPRLPCTLITLGVMFVYAGVAGFSPSVMRASLMMTVLLAGRLFGRKADGLNSLGFALFLMCLNPFAVTDVGLLLSAASALSLMTLSPLLYKKVAQLWCFSFGKTVWKSICASVSVLIYTMPILWFVYGKITVLSIWSNLFLIPVAEYTMIAALLLVLFSKIPLFGYLLACFTSFGTGLLLKLTEFLSAPGIGAVDLSGIYGGLAFAAVFILFGSTFLLQYQKHMRVTAVLSAALFLLTVTAGNWIARPNTYICTNRHAVLVYDHAHALIAGNTDRTSYLRFKQILENKGLTLSAVFCSASGNLYYNRLLTHSIETDNFILPEYDAQTAVQVNCSRILTESQLCADLWEGNHVTYSRTAHTFALELQIGGHSVVVGNAGSVTACDLAVVFSGGSSNARYALMCQNLQLDEIVTAVLRPGGEPVFRRENRWLP